MQAESIVEHHLETLAAMTQASRINLRLTDSARVQDKNKVFTRGDSLLPEFSAQPQRDTAAEAQEKGAPAQAFRSFVGAEPNTLLIHLPLATIRSPAPSGDQGDGSRRLSDSSKAATEVLWLGLGFKSAIPDWLINFDWNDTPAQANDKARLFRALVAHGASLLSHLQHDGTLIVDPLTRLPGRARFQASLRYMLSQHTQSALILVHCRGFQQINRNFGYQSGDDVIREIAGCLQSTLRKNDLFSRLGGALFAVATPTKKDNDALKLAEKIQRQLQRQHYLKGAVNLSFNLGIGTESCDSKTPQQALASIFNKADQAIKKANADSMPNITLWRESDLDALIQRSDYIGSIFTSDTTIDYRNMQLLWDISNLVATLNQFDQLLVSVMGRLAESFTFEQGGIIGNLQAEQPECDGFFIDDRNQPQALPGPPEAVSIIQSLAVNSLNSNQARQQRDQHKLHFCVPLHTDEEECLFFSGKEDHFEIAQDGELLLAALAKQLGRALARAKMETHLNLQLQQQKQLLQTELDELKQSVPDANIYYCSEQMELLMRQARRAAKTDTTTLIIGESGTGKERLATLIHQMSSRKANPLVVVDCGAIPETLIESELFGHEKGAFTGAQSKVKGRLHQADGGTLMLDEIGELPLQMQTKLLRFVQEKQFIPVGGKSTETVDVKIIAVTNRDLQQEVREGRFRQDLYYRLNVLTLETPPLREREGDIPLLARHFLKQLSYQYREKRKLISDAAMQRMQRYDWPGNVRELENRLMQAHIMCDDTVLQWADLNIAGDLAEPGTAPVQMVAEITEQDIAAPPTPIDNIAPPPTKTEIQARLADHLFSLFRQARQHVARFKNPLARWLEELLLSYTYDANNQNLNLTALQLGVSRSTLRRRLDKLDTTPPLDPSEQVLDWSQVLDDLLLIARGETEISENSLKRLRDLMLEAALTAVSENAAAASLLMGISEPTLYKWKKQLN